jgi:hypothetical protein
MLMTAASVLAFGIASAYAVTTGILNAFGRQSRSLKPSPVLVPSETHASGD